MDSKEHLHIEDFWIRTILWAFYHSEYIYANKVTLESDKIIISFRFWEYRKVISDLGHVSANQIHEAIMEWTYLVIGIALSQWRFWELLSFDDFLASRSIALYREVSIKFKKQIHQWEEVNLTFWIGEEDIRDAKWKFSTATVHFSGFVEWQSKSCLQANDFVREVILQKS
jgi:hypothetical protein